MKGLFETLKTNQLFKRLEEERATVFNDEKFYQDFKQIKTLSKNWSVEKKIHFVQLCLTGFEGMDGWYYIKADSLTNIFDLARSKNQVVECLTLLSQTFADLDTPELQKLRHILAQVEQIRIRQRSPIYRLDQKPSVLFQDVGLKFAVIHQLMFEDNKLTPKFNIDTFAEENGIVLEYRGASYEAGNYLFNLDIPRYLLDTLTTLKLNENSNVYRGVAYSSLPFYMPLSYLSGGFRTIGQEAVEDLIYLPNLEEIHLDSKSRHKLNSESPALSAEFVEALKVRGIKIIE